MYKAIPLINEKERKLTGLPAEIYFEHVNGSLVPSKGVIMESPAVMNNILKELKMQRVLGF